MEETNAVKNFLEIVTMESQVFKSISKALHKYFNEAAFMITNAGIFLQESKADASILLEFFLKREQFDRFIIPKFEDANSTIILGFSTKEMQKALEGITKTDCLKIYIRTDDINNLHMHITNPTRGKNSFKFVRLRKTNICNTLSPSYNDNTPTAVVNGAQYKKGMTEINKAASKTKIRLRAQPEGAIIVPPEGAQISGFREVWGNYIEGQPDIYDEQLSVTKLHVISELACITKLVKIYACEDDRPLKISLNAGQLGQISVYLQPDQIANTQMSMNNNNMVQ